MVLPVVPKHPLQMPNKHVTDVFALSQVHQEFPVLRTATQITLVSQGKIVSSVPPAPPPLQSTHSRVHRRSKFCSSPRLLEPACDNGWVFKVFWKKLTEGYRYTKQQHTGFAKFSRQRAYSDRWKGVLCVRLCSRSSEMKNKMEIQPVNIHKMETSQDYFIFRSLCFRTYLPNLDI